MIEILFPLREWRAMLALLERNRPLQGAYCRLTQSGDGMMISAEPPTEIQHDWFTVPEWSPQSKRWSVTIEAGFVGKWDPLVVGVGEKGAAVPLLDRPRIPVTGWRSPALNGEVFPKIFAALGVRVEKSDLDISGPGGAMLDVTERREDLPPRALVATDFYLATARATYAGQVTEIDASGTSGVTMDYSVSFDTTRLDQVGSRARLLQAPKFPETKAPTLAERLTGQFQDEGEDRIPVSTLFLVSPPNVMDGAPDGNWLPFVQHHLFWPLDYRARNDPPTQPAPPLRLFTGLGFGFADLIGNQYLSAVNEYSQIVQNAINATTNEGRYWTA